MDLVVLLAVLLIGCGVSPLNVNAPAGSGILRYPGLFFSGDNDLEECDFFHCDLTKPGGTSFWLVFPNGDVVSCSNLHVCEFFNRLEGDFDTEDESEIVDREDGEFDGKYDLIERYEYRGGGLTLLCTGDDKVLAISLRRTTYYDDRDNYNIGLAVWAKGAVVRLPVSRADIEASLGRGNVRGSGSP